MVLNNSTIKDYVLENLSKIQNYTYYILEDYKPAYFNDSEQDTCVAVVLKNFDDQDIYKLRLLSVSSLAAMIQHYNVKPRYTLPNIITFQENALGCVEVEKLKDKTYLIKYIVKVNNDDMSIKKASKKLFKIKNPELTIQTYFKIYYHFYETQDFNQVIEYMNTLQDTLVINDSCDNVNW